jgi:hypothetical protein
LERLLGQRLVALLLETSLGLWILLLLLLLLLIKEPNTKNKY